ncbi:MAG: S8 family serine peptidase [Microthrixaceae bacterium]
MPVQRVIRTCGRRPAGRAVLAAVLVAALAASCSGARTPDPAQAAPDPGRVGGSTTFAVVVFDGVADLAPASREPDWERRGRAVVRALRDTADRSQAAARRRLDSAGIAYRSLWVANAIALNGTDQLPTELERLPGVRAVLSGPEAQLAQLAPSAAFTKVPEPGPADLWFRQSLGLDALRSAGADGRGTTLGIIDTGVDATHPALSASYRTAGGRSWFDPSGVCPDRPCDPIGHGTHVAGLAVGDGLGVAPGAQWLAARGCATEACHLDDVLAALQFMLAPTDPSGKGADPSRRPAVVLASWALPEPLEALTRAVDALTAAGILQVYAAGDTGPGCGTIAAPASTRGVLSVGATDRTGAIDRVSSRGPAPKGIDEEVEPHLVAPGRDIVSTFPGNGYASASGTSMAAPLVAGTALLALQREPGLIGWPDRIGAALQSTARPRSDVSCGPVAPDGADDVYGHGVIDPAAVLAEVTR